MKNNSEMIEKDCRQIHRKFHLFYNWPSTNTFSEIPSRLAEINISWTMKRVDRIILQPSIEELIREQIDIDFCNFSIFSLLHKMLTKK